MKLYIPILYLMFFPITENLPQVSIEKAHNAYFQMDHSSAYDMYTRILNDEKQSDKDRANAGSSKAHMEWLLYRDPVKALHTLETISSIPENQTSFWILKARIQESEGNYDKALASTEQAMIHAQSDLDRYKASLYTSRYSINKWKNLILTKGLTEENKNSLKNDYANFLEFVEPLSGDVEVADLQIIYALLASDGRKAFEGWMSFYQLSDLNQVHPSLMADVKAFRSAMLALDNGNPDRNTINTIVKGLAESGFHDHAVVFWTLYSQESDSKDPEIQDLLAYHSFLEDIKEATIDYYVQTVNGKNRKSDINERKEAYLNSLITRAVQLWKSLYWEEDVPPFSRETFSDEMQKRFKAVIKPMTANGYFGLHMGHIVLDDKRTISQYDQNAEFRYISIDHMVSNGYSGWFWDGQAETGGWANDDGSFLQVRSAYSSGPVRAWMKLNDPAEKAKILEKIKENERSDDSLATIDPYAYLPGLDTRLDYYPAKDLLDSLVSARLEGSQLRINFINRISNLKLESSIYAHEGRHAIDKKNNYSHKSEELEFTAKLSEVYFSSKPKYAFTAVLGRNIGDGTSHGEANLRVIKGLVSWMKKHRSEISNFDPDRPFLPQMDKLTDEQLRAAMRSMDPMGN